MAVESWAGVFAVGNTILNGLGVCTIDLRAQLTARQFKLPFIPRSERNPRDDRSQLAGQSGSDSASAAENHNGGRWRLGFHFHSSFLCYRPENGAKSIELFAPRPSLPVTPGRMFSSFGWREQHGVNAVNCAIARFEVGVNHL